MTSIVRKYNWEIDIYSKIPPKVDNATFKQGDQNTNEINLTVFNKGDSVDLQDTTVVFLFVRPDGSKIEHSSVDVDNPITVNGNEVKCLVKGNALKQKGRVIVEMTVIRNNEILTSQTVPCIVKEKIGWLEDYEDDIDVPILQSLIAVVQNLLNELEVMQVDESNRFLNEQERKSNELLRQSNEQARELLKGQLEALKLSLEQLENTVQSNEDVRIVNEETRKSNEVLRQALKLELETLKTQLETLYTEMTDALAFFELTSSDKIDEFEGLYTASITNFETISNGKIDDFIAEIGRVETEYLDRATAFEKETQVKVAKVEKELNTLKSININSNQEATQVAEGYGVMNLPKTAGEGQVSVSVKGNTVTDETGTRSTISASRLKSVSLNQFNKSTIIRGKAPSTNNGEIENSTTYNMSSKIRLKPNTYYSRRILGNVGHGLFYYDINGNFIERTSVTSSENAQQSLTPLNVYHGILSFGKSIDLDDIMLIEGNKLNATFPNFENGKETTQYLPNVGKLRSVPSAKDEIRVTGGKAELVKRVSGEIVIDGSYTDLYNPIVAGMIGYYRIQLENWSVSNNALAGQNESVYALLNGVAMKQTHSSEELEGIWIHTNNSLYIKIDRTKINARDGVTTLDKFKNYLNQYPITLTYQLAEPIINPINVSGNLISYPSGTVYVENVVADAGLYTTKMDILNADLPIKTLDRLSKVDYTTGLEHSLDVSKAVVTAQSFTHPDLTMGDIVFFEYYYDLESTNGNASVEYYDSRYTVKDSVTNKFYKWSITIANGVPTIKTVEV